MTGKYDGDVNINLDVDFFPRLNSNTFTMQDIANLLSMGKGRLLSLMGAFRGKLRPTNNLYQFMLQEIPQAPVVKMVIMMPHIDENIARDIMDSLEPDRLLRVVLKLSQQSVFKLETLRYLELIEYGMNIILVRYLAGHYQKEDIIDDVGNIVIVQNLKELRPWLYRNLNAVFDIERWENKQKLLNRM